MKSKFLYLFLSCLIVLSLALVSCATKTTPTTTTAVTLTTTVKTTPTTTIKTSTTTPTTAPTEAALVPHYGGTLNWRVASDAGGWDPFFVPSGGLAPARRLSQEDLGMPDYTVDRNLCDFKTTFIPTDYFAGELAESWETPGMSTYIFHIREGIHWHDKPPVNGRELTAYDIEYSWNRVTALGSGFTEPSPYVPGTRNAMIKSITATDKYTLVLELKAPSLQQLTYILDSSVGSEAVAPEVIKQYGDANSWDRLIGTGPYIITDYVSGSSLTAIRNTNYWGYDELYPQNKLPYIDTLKVLIIPDLATALAALRTGKVASVGSGEAGEISWEKTASLEKTNPELQFAARPVAGQAIMIHVDTKPFDDLRVRKAMQMAIDLKTIAQSYYGGNADPEGARFMAIKGYSLPFDELPEDIKEGYAYNPSGAKKLLSDAGYPNGFITTLTVQTTDDLDLLQILKSYWAEIGIDCEIQAMTSASFAAYTRADKHVIMTRASAGGVAWAPMSSLNQFYSKGYPYRHHLNDSKFDELWQRGNDALSEDEMRQVMTEADIYVNSQYWRINLPPFFAFTAYQPWLKRFNGESGGAKTIFGGFIARLWIDQDLQITMGH